MCFLTLHMILSHNILYPLFSFGNPTQHYFFCDGVIFASFLAHSSGFLRRLVGSRDGFLGARFSQARRSKISEKNKLFSSNGHAG